MSLLLNVKVQNKIVIRKQNVEAVIVINCLAADIELPLFGLIQYFLLIHKTEFNCQNIK